MPKEKIKRWVENTAVNWIASFLYIVGLSLIIPLWTYLFSPFRLFTLQFVSTIILAGSLILASYSLLRAHYNSRKKAYWHLSLATIVPAILAVVLSFFSADFFFAVVNAFIVDTTSIRPLIDLYLDNKVPKIASVVFAYAGIGLFLLYLHKKQ